MLFVERGPLFCRPAPAEPWIPLASGDVLVLARPADYVFATDPEAPVREAPATPYVVNEGLADHDGDRAVVYAGKMEPDAAMAELFFTALPRHAVIRPTPTRGASAGSCARSTRKTSTRTRRAPPSRPAAS